MAAKIEPASPPPLLEQGECTQTEGIAVEQTRLQDYFASVDTINQAIMVRRGRRVVIPDLVNIRPGERGFLSDVITLKEGMVPPEKHKVLMSESLVCDGQGNCRRMCGGRGQCVEGCRHFRERRSKGHFCTFNVRMIMYTNAIGVWYVMIRGSHVGPNEVWNPPDKNPLRNPEVKKYPEYEGIAVEQTKLEEYFASVDKISKAKLLRKGRIVNIPDLVNIQPGERGFLTDIITLKSLVSPPEKDRILMFETLVCNGQGNCRTACGGSGKCVEGCPHFKERASSGHFCTFNVKLNMYTGEIGVWYVTIRGSHVGPNEVWHPPDKNPLHNPVLRQQYIKAFEAGFTSCQQLEAVVDTPEKVGKSQLRAFVKTLKKRQCRQSHSPNADVLQKKQHQIQPSPSRRESRENQNDEVSCPDLDLKLEVCCVDDFSSVSDFERVIIPSGPFDTSFQKESAQKDGIAVEQTRLEEYLASMDTVSKAKLLRKGRIVNIPDLVDIQPGESGFLSDIITLKSGVSPPEKDTVLVFELLVCNGQGNCRRVCGGSGKCVEGCRHLRERVTSGHFCTFNVKLIMYTGEIGVWYVSVRGSHVAPDEVWHPPDKKPVQQESPHKDSIVVEQTKLEEYFASVDTISKAKLLRKGRTVNVPDLVDIQPGEHGFLSDIITLKSGVSLPEKDRVLMFEMLVCNGQGNCRRACGGSGKCVEGCSHFRERASHGHFCAFNVKLAMYTGAIGVWYVTIRGSHVGPDEVWQPPDKNPLCNPMIRAQYIKAFEAGYTTCQQLEAVVDTPEKVEKSKLRTFVRTLRKRKQKKSRTPNSNVPQKKQHRIQPHLYTRESSEDQDDAEVSSPGLDLNLEECSSGDFSSGSDLEKEVIPSTHIDSFESSSKQEESLQKEGIAVEQTKLEAYFASVDTISKAKLLRKGRIVKIPDLVNIQPGERGFLSDIITLKSGVSPPEKDMVLMLEMLFCNGQGNCRRACGGSGKCAEGCPHFREKMANGHFCAFNVKLIMYTGTIGVWYVSIRGSHVAPDEVWSPPDKNPLHNPMLRQQYIKAYEAGYTSCTQLEAAVNTPEKVEKFQLQSFVRVLQRKKRKQSLSQTAVVPQKKPLQVQPCPPTRESSEDLSDKEDFSSGSDFERVITPSRNLDISNKAWSVGKVNRIAMACPDLDKAIFLYRNVMQAKVSAKKPLLEQGVTTVLVNLGETKIELLQPLGDRSPIKNFLDKHPDGGVHHICLEVADIREAIEHLKSKNICTLSDVPFSGTRGKPAIFLHPKDCSGVRFQLEEA